MNSMKIECSHCGCRWEVYERNFTDDLNRYCPNCGEGIDSDLWQKYVLRTFGQFIDLNHELAKHGLEYHETLFNCQFLSTPLKTRRGRRS